MALCHRMKKLFAYFVALQVISITSNSTTYVQFTLTELVDESVIIVVAKFEKRIGTIDHSSQFPECGMQFSKNRLLKGELNPNTFMVSYHCQDVGIYRESDAISYILFLGFHKGNLYSKGAQFTAVPVSSDNIAWTAGIVGEAELQNADDFEQKVMELLKS